MRMGASGLAVVTALLASDSAWAAGGARLPDGRRIVNMVDDFLAYHDAVKDRPADRDAEWTRRLEVRYPAFFDQVLYRRATGKEREAARAECQRVFWADVAPGIDDLRRSNRTGEKRLLAVRETFAKTFDDFRPETDFHLTVACGNFMGKVVDLNDSPVLALSLDRFPPEDVQFDITAAHEMFHLYHFKTFSTRGAAYRSLWAEGLATWVSAQVVPGQRDRVYLHFSIEKMNECHRLFAALSADLLHHLTDAAPVFRRRYFGAEPNETKVPPEAGYYVGYRVAEQLAKAHDLKTLARWMPEEVLRAVRPVLAQFAGKTTEEEVQQQLYPRP